VPGTDVLRYQSPRSMAFANLMSSVGWSLHKMVMQLAPAPPLMIS